MCGCSREALTDDVTAAAHVCRVKDDDDDFSPIEGLELMMFQDQTRGWASAPGGSLTPGAPCLLVYSSVGFLDYCLLF